MTQVVSRVIPLMLHRPLIAQMVMYVTRQVVQVGLCMGMTRTGCNRRVFSLGRSVSTGEARAIISLLAGNQTGCFSVLSHGTLLVGIVSLLADYLYIHEGSCVIQCSVFLLKFLSILFVFLFYFFFQNHCICPVFQYQFLNYFMLVSQYQFFLCFVLVSQYQILYKFSLFIISGHLFVSL